MRHSEGVRTGESRNAILLSQRTTFTVRINFGDDDLILGVLESVRQLFVHRGEVLTVSTPRGEAVTSTGILVIHNPAVMNERKRRIGMGAM